MHHREPWFEDRISPAGAGAFINAETLRAYTRSSAICCPRSAVLPPPCDYLPIGKNKTWITLPRNTVAVLAPQGHRIPAPPEQENRANRVTQTANPRQILSNDFLLNTQIWRRLFFAVIFRQTYFSYIARKNCNRNLGNERDRMYAVSPDKKTNPRESPWVCLLDIGARDGT